MNTSFELLSTEHPWQASRVRNSTSEQRRTLDVGIKHYSLAPESPLHSDDDDRDSVLSIQAKETDYVRDTSDTGSYEGSSDEEWEEPLEYEPATESETEAPMHDGNTSGDTDTEIISTKVISVDVVEEAEAFADSEQSDAPSDPELGPNDYWQCAQCRNPNNNPLYRYCEKCFKVRKNFFPPRPKRKSAKEPIHEIKPTFLGKESPSHSRSGSQTDSGFDSAYNSQETLSQESATVETKENVVVNLGDTPNVILGKKRSSERDDECDRPNKRARTSSSSQVNNNMCIVCCSEPKSGVFVHGRIAHICCCYKCAVKVWSTAKRCPVCNCKVSNVLKAVVM